MNFSCSGPLFTNRSVYCVCFLVYSYALINSPIVTWAKISIGNMTISSTKAITMDTNVVQTMFLEIGLQKGQG